MKAVIGPWVHKYPHFAWPKPRSDFHAEAIRWWNRWLRDEENGADAVPQMRAYILDGPRPAAWRAHDPGYWVAVDAWAPPTARAFFVDAAGRLTDGAGAGTGQAIVHSPLDTGTASGEWFTLKPDAEMAGDQRPDDAGSLTFDTVPLAEEAVFLGQPELDLALTCPAPVANLVARIVDVHPDGTATRVSLGVLNLAHRDGNADPAPLVPGERVRLHLTLDACGYRLAPGHRLRLALSTAYWPMILPPPIDAPVTIDTASLRLAMPLLGAHTRPPMPEPNDPDPLPAYITVVAGQTRRSVERDLLVRQHHLLHPGGRRAFRAPRQRPARRRDPRRGLDDHQRRPAVCPRRGALDLPHGARRLVSHDDDDRHAHLHRLDLGDRGHCRGAGGRHTGRLPHLRPQHPTRPDVATAGSPHQPPLRPRPFPDRARLRDGGKEPRLPSLSRSSAPLSCGSPSVASFWRNGPSCAGRGCIPTMALRATRAAQRLDDEREVAEGLAPARVVEVIARERRAQPASTVARRRNGPPRCRRSLVDRDRDA